jgi:hypothetical protein
LHPSGKLCTNVSKCKNTEILDDSTGKHLDDRGFDGDILDVPPKVQTEKRISLKLEFIETKFFFSKTLLGESKKT